MSILKKRLALVCGVILCLLPFVAEAGIASPPDAGDPGLGARVTMSETQSGGAGGYSIRNNSNLPAFGPAIRIFGVAIENNGTDSAFTTRSRWGATALTESKWNGSALAHDGFAVELAPPFGPNIVLFYTDDLGSMKALFGPDAEKVNFYWINHYVGVSDPGDTFIDPGEISREELGWTYPIIASDYIAFSQQGQVLYQSFAPTAAPEPASLALIGLGLGALGLLRRRRRIT